MNVALMRPMGQPMDQPGIGMKVEDNWLICGEERLELSIGQAMRVLRMRHQLEQIDDIDEPDFHVGKVLAQQGGRCQGLHCWAGRSGP